MSRISLVRQLSRAALFALSIHAAALAQPVSSLEQLLNDKQYAAFHLRADREAPGNAEASFLKGKSFHLGLGVEQDLAAARLWYGEAFDLGSARAAHNIGRILLDEKAPDEAIAWFEKALAMGLKKPTLFNLGKAYTPTPPRFPQDIEHAIVLAEKAAHYYEQAYLIDPQVDTAALVGRSLVQVVDYSRVQKEQDMPAGRRDVAASRAGAIKWLTLAMNQGSAAAATNFGTMLLMEKNEADARPLFERGAAGGNAMAHYQLGRMEKQEDEASRARALAAFEEAARLGSKEAGYYLLPIYQEMFEAAQYSSAKLEVLANKLARLDQEEWGRELQSVRKLQTWRKFLSVEQAKAASLPALPVRLKACGLLNGQEFERPYHMVEGDWNLVAYHVGDVEPTPTGIIGTTRQGCAVLPGPFPDRLRQQMKKGSIFALQFIGIALPLKMTVNKQHIALGLHPREVALPVDPSFGF
ncbi:sel1 repeat family protein [Massilia sp. PAMC28688]|uniref:tetratricopeptide repeat protein n=1 Tax=Massilia sp. PAMC28688 TaxID=2861283 RepID=UPI001C62F83E|nr:tetratricopeptide repeat protein [Massilia sp. PAMC28688]QYF91602.1 sel1 repeat family protein [Massilia sp. PAMC28688]